MTAVVFILVSFFLVVGMPVAFSLGVVGLSSLFALEGGGAFYGVTMIIYESLHSFTLTAIPLFILMANILIHSRISEDLYRFIHSLVGHWPGGLGIATVLFCAGFSAISGSSVATAATVGMLAIPEMLQMGYDRRFTFGLVAAGGTLGILIPPSLSMILYGALTDVSVGDLFIAGIIPGLILTGFFLIYTVIHARKQGYVRTRSASWNERAAAFRRSAWGLILPPLVLGGIYLGWFTPTEAAAVGVVYSLAAALISRRIKILNLMPVLLSSLRTTVMVLIIIVGAILFGHVVTILHVPQRLITFLGELDVAPWQFIILVCIIFIFLGDFLEVVSITIITLPIIFPILLSMGIDPVWFAVIMTINMEFALITPPVGLNLFVIKGVVEDATLMEVFQGTLPFMLLMLAVLILVILFPQLSLWLPFFVR
jgi:C4-dicarboxylate transporter, DctM subunit